MMKNIAKYFSGLFLLLLAVVFISTSKSDGKVATYDNSVMAFVSGDYSNNSYAEVTPINFSSLTSGVTAIRRITRTNQIPSQVLFGGNTAFCFSNQELFAHKNTNNYITLANELVSKDYIHVLCCIRI